MSTYVQGVKPPDLKWKQMKAIWESCHAAQVEIPKEVRDFFNNEKPDKAGVVVDLEVKVDTTQEYKEIWEVDLDKLPKDIKIIRFIHSY
jgi:hypothetical protein